jgi:hypothetical protein
MTKYLAVIEQDGEAWGRTSRTFRAASRSGEAVTRWSV